MAVARIEHSWLAFDRLDSWGPMLKKSYAMTYRFTDDRDDPWTARFNEFKFGRTIPSLNAMRSVATVAVTYLLECLGLAGPNTVFVSVLGSGQTMSTPGGRMENVTASCAQSSGCSLDLSVLRKRPYESLSASQLSASERWERLDAAQYNAEVVTAKTFILFDDVITTGSTIGHVAQTLKQANPGADVYGVALAKAEGREFNRNRGIELTNGHVPTQWEGVWADNYGS